MGVELFIFLSSQQIIMPSQKTVVFVDFDGTLYQRDSLLDFLIFAVGKWRTYISFILLFPEYLFSSNKAKVKNKWMKRLLEHKSETELHQVAQKFIPLLQEKLNAEVVSQIAKYEANKAEIVILSASLDLWIRPFCESRGYVCIATPAVYSNQIFSGFEVERNVKGEEKLKLAKAYCDFSKCETVAFGNEKSDLFILREVNLGYWVNGNQIHLVS